MIASAPPNRLVVALIYDDLRHFEFSCVAEVFGLPRPEFGPGWYRFETAARGALPVRAGYGSSMQPDGGYERLVDAGTVVLPGWNASDAPTDPALIEALLEAHRRGARVLSICSGAFLLAATGLLDGRRAATHWMYADELQRMYPKVHVDPRALYIDEGQVLTSAGSAAGLDLGLHLVRRDHGSELANRLARRLVIPPHREGGQAQYIERPVFPADRDAIARVLEVMLSKLEQDLPVSTLADMASMSERTFMRRFKQKTGVTPATWLAAARVYRARELLEATGLSIEQIATRCGLGSPTNFRHHFQRRIGTSPSQYRVQFGQRLAAQSERPAGTLQLAGSG